LVQPPQQEDTSNESLTIRFFGVSTLLFDDGADQVLVDGFFSRPNLRQTLFTALQPNRSRFPPELGRSAALEMILVAHAHHDHVLDAPAIALDHEGAVIAGTPSVIALSQAQGVPDRQLCTALLGDTYRAGEYQVRPLAAIHGPGLPILGAVLDRRLDDPPEGPAHFLRFLDDENFSFFIQHGSRTILVHPSAGLPLVSPPAAEIVFLGIGRTGTLDYPDAEAYFDRVISSDPTAVIPIHWDAFTSAPDEPLEPSPYPLDRVDRALGYLCRFAKAHGALQVMMPAMGDELTLSRDGGRLFSGAWSPLCTPGGP
jgi:L-ascorbate metabolism protein UlaG (beta-lactamase superfamily)